MSKKASNAKKVKQKNAAMQPTPSTINANTSLQQTPKQKFHERKFAKITQLPIAILCLFLIILSIILNPWSPIFKNTIASQPNEYIFGQEQTITATKNIVNYLWFGITLKDIQIPLSTQATTHLKDVRNLFIVGQLLTIVVTVLTVATCISLPRRQQVSLLANAALGVFCLTLTFALVATLNFTDTFTLFHKILFTNELWLFDPSDTLVQLYPTMFFMIIAKKIIFYLLLTSSIFYLIARATRVKSSDQTQHI